MEIYNYDVYVFDLDGTILDTEKNHCAAWERTMNNVLNEKINLNYYEYCKIFHVNENDKMIKNMEQFFKIKIADEIFKIKNDKYMLEIKNKHIEYINGWPMFINELIKRNKKIVLVTNTYKKNFDLLSEKYDLLKKFDMVFTRENYTKKKPDSECYNNVIKKFENKKIIGFEDSLTGITSLCNSDNIDCVFVQKKDYYHYEHIKKTYPELFIIDDYIKFI